MFKLEKVARPALSVRFDKLVPSILQTWTILRNSKVPAINSRSRESQLGVFSSVGTIKSLKTILTVLFLSAPN